MNMVFRHMVYLPGMSEVTLNDLNDLTSSLNLNIIVGSFLVRMLFVLS